MEMVLTAWKRIVYVGLFLTLILSPATENHYVEGLDQGRLDGDGDGVDDRPPLNSSFQSIDGRAGLVTQLHGFQQVNGSHQDVDQPPPSAGGRSRSRKRAAALSIEERKRRKKETDARYRNNRKAEMEKLKEENTRLRNMYSLNHGQQLPDTDRDLPVFVEENQLQLFPACYLTFMEKLEGDEERRSVSYFDLNTLLQGETRQVVKGYRIPLVLMPIYESIVTSYGDITSHCLLCPFSAQNVLLRFLATIKEMQETLLEQVTEELILRWRDCIAEAKCINFAVDFARQHLNKIADSYFGRKACNEMTRVNNWIEVLKEELSYWQERVKQHETLYPPQLLAASKDFPATVGLFS